MPSRIRIALDAEGQIISGPIVSKWVYNALAAIKKKQGRAKGESHVGYILGVMDELAVLYDKGRPLGFRVFIWREPRGVSRKNSGYVQFLRQNGIEREETKRSPTRRGDRPILTVAEPGVARPGRRNNWRNGRPPTPAVVPEPQAGPPWNNPTFADLEAMRRQPEVVATTEAINRFRVTRALDDVEAQVGQGIAGAMVGGAPNANVRTAEGLRFNAVFGNGTWRVEE